MAYTVKLTKKKVAKKVTRTKGSTRRTALACARQRPRRQRSHFRGALLGGAIGDALGAPVEFISLAAIRRSFGAAGLSDYAPAYGRRGAITDDTQMTLFTAEAMLRAHNAADRRGLAEPAVYLRQAYLRWLATQGEGRDPRDLLDPPVAGGLLQQKGLHARRAPGNTCLSALRAGGHGTPAAPLNDSKGCGGIMRVAPVGLVPPTLCDAFEVGGASAALTHGHPSGYLSAAFFAQLVADIAAGAPLARAIHRGVSLLRPHTGHEETLAAVERAVELARAPASPEAVESLGGAWVGEEALAIALYCALKAESFEHGVLLAVNHGGDSDSTGSLVGTLLGLLRGVDAIPQKWIDGLELRDVIEPLAHDLWRHFGIGS